MTEDNPPMRPTSTDSHEHRDSNLPVPAAEQSRAIAPPEDIAAFQVRLLRLLERRTAIYTMGDSTSVPKHVAADLLRSICFVLGIDPDDPEVPQQLLNVDLEAEYRRRLDDIGRRLERAQELWREVAAAMPLIENIALRDTLENIGEFFKWYDYRSMAHETAVMIDYPLCHPVPESLQGIDYIEEYLRRLMIEADFLGRFELPTVERVLAASCPDYIGLLINLYEPVATNAIGRVLAEKDPRPLSVSREDRAVIGHRLRALPRGRRPRALRDAAAVVCDRLGIDDPASREYLNDLVPELLPRIEVGLTHSDLQGVFLS